MTRLTGPQKRQLVDAVLGAFNEGDLTMLLAFDLDVRFAVVVGGGPLEQKVFELTDWLDGHGRMDEFLAAIAKSRPRNQEIQQVVAGLGSSPGPSHPA